MKNTPPLKKIVAFAPAIQTPTIQTPVIQTPDAKPVASSFLSSQVNRAWEIAERALKAEQIAKDLAERKRRLSEAEKQRRMVSYNLD